jgi:hypothetical protein
VAVYARRSLLGLVVVLFFGLIETVGADDVQGLKLRELQVELEQRERVIRQLQESLAVTRTEAELFRQRWMEARLRAQQLGVEFSDPNATSIGRQLTESLRLLSVAEADKLRMVEQVKRLLAAIKAKQGVSEEVERSQELLTSIAEMSVVQTTAATLEKAKVLEVNQQLRLVVLDVGLQQRARVGMPFEVKRNGRVIAELRVVEVRQRICGALIEKVENGVTIASGDAVNVTKS